MGIQQPILKPLYVCLYVYVNLYSALQEPQEGAKRSYLTDLNRSMQLKNC